MIYQFPINIIFIIFSFPCSALAHSKVKTIPTQAILEANITITQGKKIYANGEMQAVARIGYQVNNGFTVIKDSIELKEFGSGKNLSAVGWSIDPEDSGNDHNIDQNTRDHINNVLPNFTYVTKYISTTKNNSNIRICFELPIKENSKNKLIEPYSTCEDESIADGTARIMAERPSKYSGIDFQLSPTNVGFIYYIPKKEDNKDKDKDKDLAAQLYSLIAGPNIPKNMTFRLINQPQYAPTEAKAKADNSGKAFLRKFINKNLPNDTNKHPELAKKTGYVQSTLIQPDTAISTELIMLLHTDYDTDETRTLNYGFKKNIAQQPIFHIWHSKYYRNTFLSGTSRCKKFNGTITTGNSVCRIINEENKSVHTDNTHYSDYPQEIHSKNFILKDNFGTEHQITITFGAGDKQDEITAI